MLSFMTNNFVTTEVLHTNTDRRQTLVKLIGSFLQLLIAYSQEKSKSVGNETTQVYYEFIRYLCVNS
jgi:hypothetical protein